MKVPRLLTFLLVPAVLLACQKEELTGPGYNPDAVTFDGVAAFAASSSSEEAFDLLWEADVDRIGLFTFADGQPEQTNVYYAAASTGQGSVKFMSPSRNKGIEWDGTSTAKYDVYAYYPYRASNNDYTAIPVSVRAGQGGMPGDLRTVKDNLSLYASAAGIASSAGNVPLDFSSPVAVVRLDISSSVPIPNVTKLTLTADQGVGLAFEAGSLDLTDGTLTIAPEVSPSNVIEYTFDEPVTLYSDPVSVYIAVNPVAAGLSIDLGAEYGDGVTLALGELQTPAETGIAGETLTVYDVYFEYAGAPGYEDAIDLSANGTANTYIVSRPGTNYRFDATVKGNGIPRTFTWTESDGTEITRSYSDLDISPVDVRLVWYNTPMTADGYPDRSPVELGSLMYELGTVYFSTPEPFVPGNVLIAAYNESGEILWSWNIWAAENYDPDATARPAGRYTMMDRNIGAVAGPEVRNSPDEQAVLAVGNYYQWGRKDPFPAPAAYRDDGLDGGEEMFWGLPTHTPIAEYQQDYSSESWGAANLIFGSNPSANSRVLSSVLGNSFTVDQAVEEAVRYPYRWMFWSGTDSGNDNYNWTRSSLSGTANAKAWRYLWGNPVIDPEYGTEEADNLKTIYDPCPPGWKVMPREAYAFAAASLTTLTNGLYNERTGFYFPNTGQRQAGFGGSQIRSLVGGTMFLETSNVTESNQWQANQYGLATGNSYIGAGYNVRCVKEELGSLTLSHAGPACVLIGDSITRTWNSYVPGFFSTHNCIAFGADGTTTNNFVSRFFSQVIANDPKVVHIMGGINDMAGNDGSIPTEEEIFENFKTMAEQAASWGIKVMIGSTPPAGRIGWHDDEWNAEHPVIPRVQNLNKMLKAYCEERGFTYVDYYSALVDETGALKQQYRNDDVHPNTGCFENVMGPIFLDALQKAMYVQDSSNPGGNVDDFEKEPWN